MLHSFHTPVYVTVLVGTIYRNQNAVCTSEESYCSRNVLYEVKDYRISSEMVKNK